MGMDPFANQIRIDPGADSSFVVRVGDLSANGLTSIYGFTNLVDLMTWLQRAAQAQQAAEVETLGEANVVHTGYTPSAPSLNAAGWPAGKVHIGDPPDRTRRTTALGSLADRIAAAETPKGAA